MTDKVTPADLRELADIMMADDLAVTPYEEMAARVLRQAADEIERQQEIVLRACNRSIELAEQLARAVEALEWYAAAPDRMNGRFDDGERARQALAAVKGDTPGG